MYYTKYYSGSDVMVYVRGPYDQILLDRCSGLGIQEVIATAPVYSLGNSEFEFSNTGNVLVSGSIELNYTDPGYLVSAIHKCFLENKPEKDPYNHGYTVRDEVNTKNMKYKDIVDKKAKRSSAVLSTSLMSYPNNFGIVVVFNNSSITSSEPSKSVAIHGVRITNRSLSASTSDDGNVIERFGFIAKGMK